MYMCMCVCSLFWKGISYNNIFYSCVLYTIIRERLSILYIRNFTAENIPDEYTQDNIYRIISRFKKE